MEWFLYDRDVRNKTVNQNTMFKGIITTQTFKMQVFAKMVNG